MECAAAVEAWYKRDFAEESPEVLQLVRQLQADGVGRRTEPYHSDDGVSQVSWWTFDEVRRLREELPARDFPAGPNAMGLMGVLHDALDSAHAAAGGLVITVF